jgi:hypothetical protein
MIRVRSAEAELRKGRILMAKSVITAVIALVLSGRDFEA